MESQLADFLVFLRRILSLRVAQRASAFVKWIDPLMSIISYKCNSENRFHNLRTKLLAFHILEALLPACSDLTMMKQVRRTLFLENVKLLLKLISTTDFLPLVIQDKLFCFLSDCGSVVCPFIHIHVGRTRCLEKTRRKSFSGGLK